MQKAAMWRLWKWYFHGAPDRCHFEVKIRRPNQRCAEGSGDQSGQTPERSGEALAQEHSSNVVDWLRTKVDRENDRLDSALSVPVNYVEG